MIKFIVLLSVIVLIYFEKPKQLEAKKYGIMVDHWNHWGGHKMCKCKDHWIDHYDHCKLFVERFLIYKKSD